MVPITAGTAEIQTRYALWCVACRVSRYMFLFDNNVDKKQVVMLILLFVRNHARR